MNREDYLAGKITHGEYYRGLAKEHHITLGQYDLLSCFGIKSIMDLRDLLRKDKHLNNIPLNRFDTLTMAYNAYNFHKRLTFAEGCCIYKALLTQMAEA